MIQITDNTLAMLKDYLPPKEVLHTFCQLLFVIGVDVIELSIPIYEQMEQLPDQGKFILQIDYVEQKEHYPGFYRYVCHHEEAVEQVVNAIQINDIREIVRLRTLDQCREVRIIGLDDMLCKSYDKMMEDIKRMLPKSKINFCPENSYACASALAVQWILNGGYEITTSFAGYKNKAATEEVLMALRLSVRHKPNRDLTVLPELTALFEEMTNLTVGNKKPILGKNIFKVEAGIHADGLIKNPTTYEAYCPDCVGGKRQVVIGKHSGIKAVKFKLQEMEMSLPSDEMVERILNVVKEVCTENKTSLSDKEFQKLAIEVIAHERKQTNC